MDQKRSSLNRRQFLARSAAAAGTASVGGGLFDALIARGASAESQGRSGVGYGPLRPAGEDLALPVGFQYQVISNEGDPMEDGFPTPKAMDGMAAFAAVNGNILLVRNHEDGQAGNTLRPRPAGSTSSSAGILAHRLETHYGPRTFAYDPYAAGGTVHPGSGTAWPAPPRAAALESRRHGSELCGWADAVGQLAQLRGDAR